MTQEQKAKAYDEALERARVYFENENYTEMADVFPELKESEDERIRKELIEAIEVARVFDIDKEVADRWIAYLEKQKEYVSDNFDDVWTTEDCAEIIEAGEKLSPRFKELFKEVCHAWHDKGIELEKQKEPLPIPDKFSRLKSLLLQYLQSAANRKDDSEIESDTDLWGRKILDYVWKYSDEQKEQKPEECKLEDAFENYTDAGITISCGDMITSPTDKPLFKKGDWVVYDGVLGHGILQVKDIKAGRYTFVDNESTLLAADSDKYLRPLTPKDLIKPAEWSDGDEGMINCIIATLCEESHGGREKNELMVSWLDKLHKSLRPQRYNP